MAFQPIDSVTHAKFNSSNSGEFLKLLERTIDDAILEGESHIPSRTFAPSQIRCKRVSWFRLRGVIPEKETIVDRATNFTTVVGSACHQNIQNLLSKKLGSAWVDPEMYLNSKNLPYKYTCTKNGLETQIEITDPVPIKFAPDGIIFWKDKYWLLEIKTSAYSSFDRLESPKTNHIDQIKCYATILSIPNVLVVYQDRQYGGLKCYEVSISNQDMQDIWGMFNEVQHYVLTNTAPPKPTDTRYCNSSYCRYCSKCKEW